jgi:regulator of cell morphogenesis and NO signaling
MKITENNIIGELVAHDYHTASIFKKYGIDFCCQGNRTIEDACNTKKIDSKLIIADLNSITQMPIESSIDYQSWPIDLLADYIEKKHHRYVEEKIQEIKSYLEKICRVHGDKHPELIAINQLFSDAASELAVHMKKEELVLFPFVRKMVVVKKSNSPLNPPHFGTVENPIHAMMHEHNNEGERFRKIESLSNNYTPPQDACNTYRVTFALLKEFESDLHLHIHLENNILFPKAIELEKQLTNV